MTFGLVNRIGRQRGQIARLPADARALLEQTPTDLQVTILGEVPAPGAVGQP